tara:strand:- start:1015 stop:1188 length:174 start_codon:yes stop_codon:yes gene_type:complete
MNLRCNICPYLKETFIDWKCKKIEHQLKNGYSMLYHGGEVDEEDARCGITDKELRND